VQVHHLLEKSFSQFPDAKVLWDQQNWYTYRQLNKTADSIAAYLVHQKIHRGDRVAILLENSFLYVASYFGILKAGAVVVGLNTDTISESLIYLLNDSDSRCIITGSKYHKILEPALKKCATISDIILTDVETDLIEFESIPEVSVKSILSIEREFFNPVVIRSIDIDLAEIIYTSGSTGKSKGVMLSHLNLVSNMRSICSYLHLTKDDRIMVVLPFYYIYGKSLLLTHIMKGASMVIDNRFVYPNKVLENMKENAVTGFAGVPSTFLILLNRSSLKKLQFDKLRYVTQAGGAMAPTVQKEVVQALSPADIYIMYGATEAAPRLAYLEPDLLFCKWGSIGIPVDNVDLLICDSEGNEVPRGEVGEIVARGSNIMMGYWKDTEETNQVLKNGMYYTGDLGKQDEQGFFYIVGRKKDIIKVKGFRVGAKEIEELIMQIDEVHETAVIGVDDPILGEAILALIIPKEMGWCDKDRIKTFLNKNLPSIKQPRYIEFRNSFPKNKSGKILKADLKEIENIINREA